MTLRAFPVTYTADVEGIATFWERLGFRRHVQLPPEGEPGYVGLVQEDGGELAVTHEQWTADRHGLSPARGSRHEMYIYVEDLDGTLAHLVDAGVAVLRARRHAMGREDRNRR